MRTHVSPRPLSTDGRLRFRPGWLEARERLSRWWHGEDLGRPVLLLTVPRQKLRRKFPFPPPQSGEMAPYATNDPARRIEIALWRSATTAWLGEAVPSPSVGDIGANSLAAYLGCNTIERPDTTWFESCIREPEEARFAFDPENKAWRYSLATFVRMAEEGRGKILQQFPDLIEGLDTLEAMRGGMNLLTDLIERPEWVHACLRQITPLYFRHYDLLYDMLRDEIGGSVFWLWAPGRLAKLQCDFSAMISPSMFGEFMVPVLREMTERLSYAFYHWDGPGAIPHHDHLLSLPKLDMIQWTAGAGAEPATHPRWWPLYHKTFEAGKAIFISLPYHRNGEDLAAEFRVLRREFGPKLNRFVLGITAPDLKAAKNILAAAEA